MINTMFETIGPGRKALRRGRYSQVNGIYFITAITDHRIPWFQHLEIAQLVCRELEQPAYLSDATNLCWVLMPDHIHLLLQLGNVPLTQVMNRLKSRTAILLNQKIGRSGRFWARSFHDHALRKEEDLVDVARYIVANPVRARLVNKAGDYPYWNCVWL